MKVSDDRTQLELSISNASTATSLRLWTDKTYKDFTKALDFTSKLSGSSSQDIVITLSEIDESFFSGVYFLELESPTEIALDFTYDITKYHECIIKELIKFSACNDCLENKDLKVINIHSIIRGLQYSLDNKFINKILTFTKALDKYCIEECTSCAEVITSNDVNLTADDIEINVVIDGENA